MNKKGFTLTELLIVVAIIAVLAIISIPVFASQIEKSSESADISNIKSAKSAAATQYISGVDLDGNIIADKGFTCYFDASSGILTKDIPSGYGKGTETDGGCEDTELVINPSQNISQDFYTSKSNVENDYISVYINSSGTIKLSWISNESNTNNALDNNINNSDGETESQEEDSYIPPSGSTPYLMTKDNRNMIGYSSENFNPPAEFEYNGTKYYLKGFDDHSFDGYSGIITIPESVDYISYYAFYNCSRITGFNTDNSKYFETLNNNLVLVSKGTTSIIKAAYNQGTITLPSTVEEIYPYAFKGCTTMLRSITIPDSVTFIGEGAFYGCSYLKSITIPGSVKALKKNTIYNPSNGVSITFKNGIETIESGAIYAKTLKVVLPNSINTLSSDSFKLVKSTNTFSCTYNSKTYSKISDVVSAVNN